MTSDRIVVSGLNVQTHIGATEQERAEPQAVLIDIEVATDLARSGASDDLAETIDYDALVTDVADLVREARCALLERLATLISDQVAAKPGVSGVTVRVKKKHAPVDEEIAGITVSITRGSLA